jgi:hypothetical protein
VVLRSGGLNHANGVLGNSAAVRTERSAVGVLDLADLERERCRLRSCDRLGNDRRDLGRDHREGVRQARMSSCHRGKVKRLFITASACCMVTANVVLARADDCADAQARVQAATERVAQAIRAQGNASAVSVATFGLIQPDRGDAALAEAQAELQTAALASARCAGPAAQTLSGSPKKELSGRAPARESLRTAENCDATQRALQSATDRLTDAIRTDRSSGYAKVAHAQAEAERAALANQRCVKEAVQ